MAVGVLEGTVVEPAQICRRAWIGLAAGAPAADGRRVALRYGSERLSLLQLLLPAQAVSAWIPPLMGIDLDRKDDDPFGAILAGHLDEENKE